MTPTGLKHNNSGVARRRDSPAWGRCTFSLEKCVCLGGSFVWEDAFARVDSILTWGLVP